jgi:2-phospho-L-lactate guanylyltransferase
MVSVLILIRMRNAKSRLSGILTQEMREELTALMFSRVLSSASDLPVYVLSPTLFEGDFVWIEDRWKDINSVVAKACERIDDDLLILPSDIPAIRKEDVGTILAHDEDLVLVPARDGGTNALFMKKGISFETHYGPKSFFLHKKEAEEKGLSFCVLPLERIRDVDTEEDLFWYHARADEEMKKFISSLLAKPNP